MHIEQVAYAVGSKDHMGSLEETVTQHVAKGVVFLAEGEYGSRREA